MIESVSVRDLGVIDVAEVELGPGLTVITGETGAGKTMLLTGLGLLWGERADPTRVRQGCEQARVEGVFCVTEPAIRHQVDAIVAEIDGHWDDDRLIVARSVSAEGRSRAHLGGRSVPAGTLSEVATHLVAVHGQDDQRRLLSTRHQREALDSFAGPELTHKLAEYRDAFDQVVADIAQRREIVESAEQRQLEAENLTQLLALIESVAPVEGESETLRDEAQRLTHLDQIQLGLQSALDRLREADDHEGVQESLAQAEAALAGISDYDIRVAELVTRLGEIGTLVTEVILDLAAIAASSDADPGRLDQIETRRAELTSLIRRVSIGTDLDEPDEASILAWAEAGRDRLAELTDDPQSLADLDARIERGLGLAADRAMQVSALRRAAATDLAQRVTDELAMLAMGRARLQVQVRPRSTGDGLTLAIPEGDVPADRFGIDEVYFELASGDEGRSVPLGKGASGGERSRIMLALEVVLAGNDPVPTMVFDEVDAGVGGRAAVEVGRRLALLARHTQVLVVTHLPQVAAFADRHVVVKAGADGHITQASVETVVGEDRQRELARMLAGLEGSSSAMAHAAELLQMAAEDAAAADTPAEPRRRSRRR